MNRQTDSVQQPSVLFVCVANSCRSQMAEAVAKSLSQGRWDVWSAGSHPSGRVHPLALQMMGEIGLDLTPHYSKGLPEVPARQWDYVVTMGCGDRCPTVNAKHRIEWDIPDPIGIPLEEARRIRDQIIERVRTLVAT
jgi:protein-tyrosine-phosphatase